MISNKSKNILTIGTDTNGKGGIAILIQSYSKMFKKFNFIASHQEGNLFKKTALSISALLRCCYYCIFKPIRIVHIHTASFTDFYRQSIYVFCAKVFRKKVILHIHGAKDSRKGIFDVLECFAKNKEMLQNKIIYHIGGTGDTKTMNEFIQQHQLSSFIKYHGWVDNERKEKLFRTADIFVHPSIFESFGISILEAMSYQLPIIATPVGGITDLVENNVNGILIEPGNKKQLYEAILFLIDHPEYLSEMGHQSGKKAEKFYPPAIEKQLDHLYQSLEK